MTKASFIEAKRNQMIEEGTLPLCACGCGQYVNLVRGYEPSRFILGHYSSRWDDVIDIVKFRQVVKKLKDDYGLSLTELAAKGGISRNHLTSIMYDKRKKSVSREFATDFFRRLSGVPTAPSTHQKRQKLNQRVKINGRKEQQGLMAYNPDCYG